jgi:hypothetical protein
MPLAPPAEVEYTSYERAKKALLNHAREEGYGIAEKRSKKDKKNGHIRKVWIHCDKSGKPTATGIKRNTSSRKTDCPFELTVTRTPLLEWQVTIIHGGHNHDASSVIAQHPCHRKRTEQEKASIKALTESKIAPKHI